jgi:flagellar assembly protein FliH
MAEIIKGAGPKLVKKDSYLAMLNAVSILDAAREQGRAILREAEAQREQVLAEARAEGEAEGLRTYLTQGQELEAALRRFYQTAEPELVRLSLGIAAKLLGNELQARPEAIAAVVRDALAGVRQARRMTIAVHPTRVGALQAQVHLLELSTGCEVQVLGREDVDPAGCLIDSDCGIVDARIETRLATLERALLRRGR